MSSIPPLPGTVIRQGKAEEGESHGEGWAAFRALALIAAITAGLAFLFY